MKSQLLDRMVPVGDWKATATPLDRVATPRDLTFRRDRSNEAPRCGVAICDRIMDAVNDALIQKACANLLIPVRIAGYTDFFVSILHPVNAGRPLWPNQPLLPNYKYALPAATAALQACTLGTRMNARPEARFAGMTAKHPHSLSTPNSTWASLLANACRRTHRSTWPAAGVMHSLFANRTIVQPAISSHGKHDRSALSSRQVSLLAAARPGCSPARHWHQSGRKLRAAPVEGSSCLLAEL